MPAMLAENVYHLISRFTHQLLAEDRAMRPVTRHEADTLHKLTISVNKLKNRSTLNESMEMFGLFMDEVHGKNPEFAQQLMPFVDGFISSRADINLSQFSYLPPAKEDISETQQDIADIMAWTEGTAVIPEAEEQIDQPAAKPEPLLKQTITAGDTANVPAISRNDPAGNPATFNNNPAISRSNPAISQSEPAKNDTEDLYAEMNSLIAQLSPETRSELLRFAETNMPLINKEAA